MHQVCQRDVNTAEATVIHGLLLVIFLDNLHDMIQTHQGAEIELVKHLLDGGPVHDQPLLDAGDHLDLLHVLLVLAAVPVVLDAVSVQDDRIADGAGEHTVDLVQHLDRLGVLADANPHGEIIVVFQIPLKFFRYEVSQYLGSLETHSLRDARLRILLSNVVFEQVKYRL